VWPGRGIVVKETADTADKLSELPQLDFSTFLLSVIGSAYVHLGDAPGPDGKAEANLQLAKQDIDLLELLQDKTQGNLTGDEERLFSQGLYDLRMRFVEVSGGK
jgi:hypothetical protein